MFFFVYCDYVNIGQTVSCKTFLQGAYHTGSLMSTSLDGLMPGTQPYNVTPWNYPGTESFSSVPTDMVDWVLVELRDPGNPTLSVSKRAALLLNNGDVVDTNLSQSISFPAIYPGNYYLCIYHRNHFPVMSANPIAVPNAIPYNFSDTLNFQPYG